MANSERHAVGAALSVNGNTLAMRNLLDGLPRQYGDVVPNSQVHVTLVGFQETAIDVLTERDAIAIHNTSQAMNSYLGELMLNNLMLNPDTKKSGLGEYGRSLGVALEISPEIERLRTRLCGIVFKNLGIELFDDDFEPHVSVLQRPKRSTLHPDQLTVLPKLPQYFHVDGFDVGERFFESRRNERKKQPFANRSRGFRVAG